MNTFFNDYISHAVENTGVTEPPSRAVDSTPAPNYQPPDQKNNPLPELSPKLPPSDDNTEFRDRADAISKQPLSNDDPTFKHKFKRVKAIKDIPMDWKNRKPAGYVPKPLDKSVPTVRRGNCIYRKKDDDDMAIPELRRPARFQKS